MNYMKPPGQLDLSDRLAIEVGICNGDSFKKIARRLSRHPSTISHIEKNHEYIRYVLPKGKSLDPYTQDDMTLLMNHINSTRRASLGNKAPYELIMEEDEDMHKLWGFLKMDLIPPDEVHLKPDLFKFNK